MAGVNEGAAAPGMFRRLYDVCMEWISGPYGIWALFIIAFVESSFFPIPPDVFLIAMCVAVAGKSSQIFSTLYAQAAGANRTVIRVTAITKRIDFE